MSKTKAAGSSKNGRDSQSKRLGVKRYGGQTVATGTILIRQRGSKYEAGKNVGVGVDHTLYAKAAGSVTYSKTRKTTFSGSKLRKTVVSVQPAS
ncbi:50S ribosomal protein L27 [bacterium]|nr:50S ribosomal protein L27 [bacterium]